MNKTKREILKRIRKEEVRMKPGWWFWAKEGGIRGLWLAIMILAVFGGIGVVYFWETYSAGELWEYGEVGKTIFLEDFPHLKAGLFIFMTVIGIWILTKIGHNYRQRTWVVMIIGLLIVGLMTVGWRLTFHQP